MTPEQVMVLNLIAKFRFLTISSNKTYFPVYYYFLHFLLIDSSGGLAKSSLYLLSCFFVYLPKIKQSQTSEGKTLNRMIGSHLFIHE